MLDLRDVLFDKLYEFINLDRSVMLLSVDTDAFKLKQIKEDFPHNFINTGVAEQNSILVAVGLALAGKRVFIFGLNPFISLRCLEQIKVYMCGMNLPITIIGLGSGLSFGFDGPTHHSVHDVGILSCLSNLEIYNPCSSSDLIKILDFILFSPRFIRLEKKEVQLSLPKAEGVGYNIICFLQEVNIITTGYVATIAEQVAKELNCGLIEVFKLNPINPELNLICRNSKTILIEESISGCGLKLECDVKINLGCNEIFRYGSRDWLHDQLGMNVQHIIKRVEHEL